MESKQTKYTEVNKSNGKIISYTYGEMTFEQCNDETFKLFSKEQKKDVYGVMECALHDEHDCVLRYKKYLNEDFVNFSLYDFGVDVDSVKISKMKVTFTEIDGKTCKNVDEHPITKHISGKSVMILDTETTGLPCGGSGEYTGEKIYKDLQKYDSARMIQVAWHYSKQFDANRENDEVESHYVKSNYYVTPEALAVHKITNDELQKNGEPINEVLNRLEECILETDYIVAHNAWFDVYIIMSEFYRNNYKNALRKMKEMIKNNHILCTKKHGRLICHLPQKCSEKTKKIICKMPKLCELYEHFFQEYPEKAHHADDDVRTLLKIVKLM